jgi:hypothetical protein
MKENAQSARERPNVPVVTIVSLDDNIITTPFSLVVDGTHVLGDGTHGSLVILPQSGPSRQGASSRGEINLLPKVARSDLSPTPPTGSKM